MPKLLCPCGYVHNLSHDPDDGWIAIKDAEFEGYIEHDRAYRLGFNSPDGTEARNASNIGGAKTVNLQTRLYECPECGRLMWRKKRGETFHIYLPEDEATKVQALALAVASDYRDEQRSIRDEAVRLHNLAAKEIASKLSSTGLRCPHCREHSYSTTFVERSDGDWSFFQCPACARSFRLERLTRNEPSDEPGEIS